MRTQDALPTLGDIVETFSFLEGWMERYRYIIELGALLPTKNIHLEPDARRVQGCVSQVWVRWGRLEDGRLLFEGQSDSQLVQGLVAVVLVIFSGKTPQEILDFSPEDVFKSMHLEEGLTPQRSNGLYSMVLFIQHIARCYLENKKEEI